MARKRDAALQFVKEAESERRNAMLRVLAADGVTVASYVLEVRAIAAAAAEQSDYSAALRGYELIGKALGVFAPEIHQHMHLAANATDADFAVLSDDQLRAIANTAKNLPAPDPPPNYKPPTPIAATRDEAKASMDALARVLS